MKWTLGFIGAVLIGCVFGAVRARVPSAETPSAPAPLDPPAIKVSEAKPLVPEPPPTAAPPAPAEAASRAEPEPQSPATILSPPQPETAKTPPRSREQIVAEAEGSVALVRGKVSSGSGFVVRPGLIVTNAHVIRQEFVQNLRIHFPSATPARRGPVRAELRAEDEARDLAFLTVESDLPPLCLEDSYQFVRGQDVTLIGNPGVGNGTVLPNAVNRGVMSTQALINNQRFYQIGMSINPGDSGGPLLDAAGRVVGIATLRASKQEGLGFCVPVGDLRSALAKLEHVNARQVAETNARHRARVVARTLNLLGTLYGKGLDQCSAAWRTALERRADPGPVVTSVSQALSEKLRELNKKAFADLAAEERKAAADLRVDLIARDDLAKLWSTVSAMKASVEEPQGDFLSYDASITEFKKSQSRLFGRLKKELAIVHD